MKLDNPSRVYTMPSGAPFLRELARGLHAHLGERLSDALILLPTRRSVRMLGDAFVEEGVLGGRAALLPRMRPLADIDTDELGYEPSEMATDLPPAISPLQRRFEIARVVSLYHRRVSDIPVSTSAALALAQPLCDILDDAAMEEAQLPDHEVLEDIRQRAAEHFQHASVFYEILQRFWPDRLRELKMSDPKARQVAMLDALRERWETTPPDHPVIAAGSTGTLGATARLIRTIRSLPQGLVVLPGVDMNLRENDAWQKVDAQHPQNSLKRLLETLGVEDRGAVGTWPVHSDFRSKALDDRRRIISEALVPITAAETWPDRIRDMRDSNNVDFREAVRGLSLIEARHDEEEALAIALILREALETPDRTAALVTPDSGLARRVRTRLKRWGVEADFSQGVPLEETSLGAYIAGLLKLASDPTNPVDMAYVCKHGLSALGKVHGEVRKCWMAHEPRFRGRRPSPEERHEIWCVRQLLSALEGLTDIATATPDGWARALVRTVERVSRTDAQSGASRLWTGDAGEAAAELMEDIMRYGDLMPVMDCAEFHTLLLGMMKERVVRQSRGTHPRISILGPLEARMLSADVIVLGGLNEGTWPQLPAAAPFLSRQMRDKLGLSLPERRFGLAAHDFAQAAAHPEVVLTRSERTGEGPAVASRWVWRLKTLLRGALGDDWKEALDTPQPYLDWARAMDAHEGEVEPMSAPAPKPPVEARWPEKPKGKRRTSHPRSLSITEIKTWVRDPYSIYCKHVLGLEPLDPLGVQMGVSQYGTAVHEGLETFFRTYTDALPDNAADELSLMFQSKLLDAGFEATDMASEKARLQLMAAKVVDWTRARRSEGWSVAAVEERGHLRLDEVDFELRGKADLIETGPGGYAVVDFKTGTPPGANEVAAGFDPQLPLTALMLSEGRVAELRLGGTADMIYGEVKGFNAKPVNKSIVGSTSKGAAKGMIADDFVRDAREALVKLVRNYDDPDTAYHSHPRAKYTHDWGKYDVLARRAEWAEASGDD